MKWKNLIEIQYSLKEKRCTTHNTGNAGVVRFSRLLTRKKQHCKLIGMAFRAPRTGRYRGNVGSNFKNDTPTT